MNENSTKTKYKMFPLTNFIVSCKYTLILKFMPATQSKKSWDRSNLKGKAMLHSGKHVPVLTLLQASNLDRACIYRKQSSS